MKDRIYERLFENIPQRIFYKNKNLEYVFCNNNYAQYLNIEKVEIIGKKDADFYEEDLAKQNIMDDRRIIDSGLFEEKEEKYMHNGKEVVIHQIKIPIKDDKDNIDGILGILWDISEIRNAEKELKLLYSAIEEAPDGVQIVDLYGKVIYSNKTIEKIYGFSREEYTGLDVNKMNVDPAFANSVIIPATKNIGRWTGEVAVKHKKGHIVPIWLDTSLVKDVNNNPIAMVGIITDITEYKNMRKEINDRERFLNSVFESIQDGICILDKNLNIRRVNPTYQKWFSLDNENFLGKKCYTVFYNRQEPCEKCPSQRTLNTGQSSYNIIRKTFGNVECWLGVYTFPMIESTGEMSGVVELLRDITKQKEAEDVLRKAHTELEIRVKERTSELEEANKILKDQIEQHQVAEEQIREQAALLDNAQDAIIARDLNHRIKYWNKGAERLYGWTSEEVIGKDVNKLLYKFSDDKYLQETEKIVIKDGKWSGELKQTTKDNMEIIVESRWTLMRDVENNPKLILVINTNITEKKRLLSQLLRAQRMESIGTLAGGIAHDLNNVLTPIMLSTELLKERIGECNESLKLISMIEKNSKRGANLIKQVLSFARGLEGEKKILQISYIISEIEKIMKETFPKNISIQTEVQKDLWTIVGDGTQLHQVLMNLCVNARDAMPYGGTLKLSAENFYIDENYVMMDAEAKVGNYIVVSVTDNGIGIPISIQDRIFEPFFTTKEIGKGTGLGLSTAHAVVKGHGGFIHLYSEPGKGTKFKVYLPAKLNNVQDEERYEARLENGYGELILLAEDEDSIREITRTTLKAHGYNVIAAEDGAQALALYAQHKDEIKVVIMDIMMPILNGQDSIRAIRRIEPNVKIIAVSGLVEKDKLAKIADIQIEAFLSKPFTGEKLLKILGKILRK